MNKIVKGKREKKTDLNEKKEEEESESIDGVLMHMIIGKYSNKILKKRKWNVCVLFTYVVLNNITAPLNRAS